MDLARRLEDLYTSLGEFGPKEPVAWSLGQVFNTLLAAAKEEAGDDPVLQAIEPVEQSSSGRFSATTAGSLRALTQQIAAAVSERSGS